MKIPFSRIPLAGNEQKYVEEVLQSGWLTTSSKAMEFEEKFASRIGVKYACAVNSCTAALHLALDAIGIGKGDQVLVPSLTFTATAEVIRYLGADPVFLDVDFNMRVISPSILQEALEKRSDIRALILVHYGGQAAKMTSEEGEGIMDLCRKHGVSLVEDAAHAFPCSTGGKHVGSFGNVGCFSFYANKTITTGEGGMLVTNDLEIYKRAKIMRLHGINRDIWKRYNTPGYAWEYDVIAPGYKYNMPDINAAIGLAQLEKADEFRMGRQHCATYYTEALKDIPNLSLPGCLGPLEDHAWHLYPVLIGEESPIDRNQFIEEMAVRGMGTSVHYKPLHRMTYYRKAYQLQPGDFPNTERIWKGVVSLPIYPGLSEAELETISRAVHDLLLK